MREASQKQGGKGSEGAGGYSGFGAGRLRGQAI